MHTLKHWLFSVTVSFMVCVSKSYFSLLVCIAITFSTEPEKEIKPRMSSPSIPSKFP